METAATKALIHKVLTEAFDACVAEWNLNEIEHASLSNAIYGPETIERIFNVAHIAGMYADEGKILVHATLKGYTTPNDEKPIKLNLELGNNHNNRMKLANIGYPIVDIFALPEGKKNTMEGFSAEADQPEQLDVEAFTSEREAAILAMAEEDDDDDAE